MSISYTEPKIVTSNDLNKRSYVEFYFNNERVREYHGKNVALIINPNRAKSLIERSQLLSKLHFELKKALETNTYPTALRNQLLPTNVDQVTFKTSIEQTVIRLLFDAVRTKLRSGLSKTYKRDLKAVYRDFKAFLEPAELNGP